LILESTIVWDSLIIHSVLYFIQALVLPGPGYLIGKMYAHEVADYGCRLIIEDACELFLQKLQQVVHQECRPENGFEESQYTDPETGGCLNKEYQCPYKPKTINGGAGMIAAIADSCCHNESLEGQAKEIKRRKQ
jgi:hypothetical protein